MSGMVEVEKRCTMCGKMRKVQVPYVGFVRWRNGEHIQNAMPEVPAADRELLISGTCGECWDNLFKGEEDE